MHLESHSVDDYPGGAEEPLDGFERSLPLGGRGVVGRRCQDPLGQSGQEQQFGDYLDQEGTGREQQSALGGVQVAVEMPDLASVQSELGNGQWPGLPRAGCGRGAPGHDHEVLDTCCGGQDGGVGRHHDLQVSRGLGGSSTVRLRDCSARRCR